jgi:hypothetical protein
MKVLATVAGIGGAVGALWCAFQAAGDLYLTGFPDSHFTDYDKAVELPKRVLMWAEFGFVPLFLLLCVPRIRINGCGRTTRHPDGFGTRCCGPAGRRPLVFR